MPCTAVLAVLIAAAIGGAAYWHHVVFNARLKVCSGTQLRDIARACEAYAQDHGGAFPSALSDICPKYLLIPASKALPCPGARAAGLPEPHYAIEPGLRTSMAADYFLLYDASLINHESAGRNVAFLDLHVEWWPASREAEFQKKLAAQREAVGRWRGPGGAGGEQHDRRIPGDASNP